MAEFNDAAVSGADHIEARIGPLTRAASARRGTIMTVALPSRTREPALGVRRILVCARRQSSTFATHSGRTQTVVGLCVFFLVS